VRRRDGSEVEVALDRGEVVAGNKSTPIFELELELKAGQPCALFELAAQIATTIAVLPCTMSKAERGFALAQGTLDMPVRAQPLALTPDLPVYETAQLVLREMFTQFTRNLNALRTVDDPELVHQARVGWRRFKSARRLFRPALAVDLLPSEEALQPLLTCLGELRDLDVARTETLPTWGEAYMAGDERRVQAWQAMTLALTQAADLQRKAVRYALQAPEVGAALLAMTQWLENLTAQRGPDGDESESKESLRHWSRRRILHLHEQLKFAVQKMDKPDQMHRVRILAKRVRYDIEALRPLLPKKRTQVWLNRATRLQSTLGATRDMAQAAALLVRLEVDRGLVEFLRGLAAGQSRQW
jgi:inorganic triphosphatase YgiF